MLTVIVNVHKMLNLNATLMNDAHYKINLIVSGAQDADFSKNLNIVLSLY